MQAFCKVIRVARNASWMRMTNIPRGGAAVALGCYRRQRLFTFLISLTLCKGVRMLDGVVNDAVEARALSLNPSHIDIYSGWRPEHSHSILLI